MKCCGWRAYGIRRTGGRPAQDGRGLPVPCAEDVFRHPGGVHHRVAGMVPDFRRFVHRGYDHGERDRAPVRQVQTGVQGGLALVPAVPGEPHRPHPDQQTGDHQPGVHADGRGIPVLPGREGGRERALGCEREARPRRRRLRAAREQLHPALRMGDDLPRDRSAEVLPDLPEHGRDGESRGIRHVQRPDRLARHGARHAEEPARRRGDLRQRRAEP